MPQTNFTPVQLYRSATAAAAPLAANLQFGELALNYADEKMYFKNAAGVVKLLAGAGAVGTSGLVDNAVTPAKLANGGYELGMRNRIINGNMDVWQRGTSFTATTSFTYTADRFRVKTGSGTASVVQNPQSAANAALGKFYQTLVLSGNGLSEVSQPIEGVRTLAGQTITFSVYANIFSGSAQTVTAFATQYFGTGGSPSTSVTVTQTVTVSASGFERYTVQLVLPSLAGKTIGTNGDDQLVIGLNLPNGTYNFDHFGWQVEKGAVATPFEYRPYGLELSLCQRYYYASTAASIFMAGYTYAPNSVDGLRQAYPLPSVMRATPTAAISGGTNGGSSAVLEVVASYPSTLTLNLRSTTATNNVWFANATLTATAEL